MEATIERSRGTAKLTPMLAQYLRVKEQAGEAILFFRLGDFYEMFFDDAERAAPLLDLTLTSRNKDDPSPVPMCGVPAHAAQAYVGRLLQRGLKVAICDQLSDPAASNGLVERGLVRIITPGTALDEDEGLERNEPGFLVSLRRAPEPDAVAIATVEVSTGELRVCLAPSERAAAEELSRIAPREVLLTPDATGLEELAAGIGSTVTVQRPRDDAAREATLQTLEGLLATPELAELSDALRGALADVIGYASDTVRGGLGHLRSPVVYGLADHLMIDERTRRNLAIVEGAQGSKHGSLWWVLDKTETPMGARRLREWLLYPLLDLDRIGERLDAIERLVESPGLRDDLAEAIGEVGDLERLVARFGVGRAGPREVERLGRALVRVESVCGHLAGSLPPLLARIAGACAPPAGLAERIAMELADAPPLSASEGGIIRAGADAEVDRLRGLLRDAKRLLTELEARERSATKIGSLKIRYHRVLGYFFEVTKSNLKLVPAHFERRQSMASGERFTTLELRELEDQLSSAEERCSARELELFRALLEGVSAHQSRLAEMAHVLADLDALLSLARVAHERGYVRPRVHRGTALQVRDGRHPVVEQTSAAGAFVPNDASLDSDGDQIIVLTGPNMAGKSTYLRQVALCVLLAHAGSFVPAGEAEVPLTDRIWTRVGAADDLVAGDSTFMVEMKETAAILANLTPRTLVVLDEIGRGTSTFDGIAIAWAVAEHLHEAEPVRGARVKTLFATHFHELTALAASHPRVRNYSVAVREWRDQVLFLRKVVPGPASRSYGIAVARLAGVPPGVVARAREILSALEAGRAPGSEAAGPASASSAAARKQLDLFEDRASALWRELAGLDVDAMTPLEGLSKLHEMAERARRG